MYFEYCVALPDGHSANDMVPVFLKPNCRLRTKENLRDAMLQEKWTFYEDNMDGEPIAVLTVATVSRCLDNHHKNIIQPKIPRD